MADFFLRVSGIDTRTGNAVGWLGNAAGTGRMPVLGAMEFRGRFDAVLSFFVEGFLHDEVFEAGDRLFLMDVAGSDFRILLQRE